MGLASMSLYTVVVATRDIFMAYQAVTPNTHLKNGIWWKHITHKKTHLYLNRI